MSVRTVIGIDAEIAAKSRYCRTIAECIRAATIAGRGHEHRIATLIAAEAAGTLRREGGSLAERIASMTAELEATIQALVQRLRELR
jgi:hypothetical protein